MKKNIPAFIAAFSLTVMFSGCNNSEEPPDELEMLLEQLQTTHLNVDAPENAEDADSTTENITYKSSTGLLVSFTEDSVTIEADNKEQKFILDENTQILGGELTSAEAVTVTYNETDGKEKNITADIITVLRLNDENTDSVSETAVPETDSSDTSDASDISETLTDPPLQDVTSDIADTASDETVSQQSGQTENSI